MSTSERTYYKDAVTERRTFTRGRFDGWERGGSFGFWYARFSRPKLNALGPEVVD